MEMKLDGVSSDDGEEIYNALMKFKGMGDGI